MGGNEVQIGGRVGSDPNAYAHTPTDACASSKWKEVNVPGVLGAEAQQQLIDVGAVSADPDAQPAIGLLEGADAVNNRLQDTASAMHMIGAEGLREAKGRRKGRRQAKGRRRRIAPT